MACVLLFRGRLIELMPWILVKHKDTELSFRLERAEQVDVPRLPPPTPTQEELDRFDQIARISPRAAILVQRAELTGDLKRLAQMADIPSAQQSNLALIIRQLQAKKIIDSPTADLLNDLRVIGNLAGHEQDREFSLDDALRFKDLTQKAISAIQYFAEGVGSAAGTSTAEGRSG